MIEKKNNWCVKVLKSETLSYLFFGVLTTVVNYTIFVVGLSLVGENDVLTVNMIAFIGATLFAYITNKLFVFYSVGWKIKQIVIELGKFVGARVFSLVIEQLGLYMATVHFNVGEYFVFSINGVVITKVVLSFVAVLLNYFASKFIIFNKEK